MVVMSAHQCECTYYDIVNVLYECIDDVGPHLRMNAIVTYSTIYLSGFTYNSSCPLKFLCVLILL